MYSGIFLVFTISSDVRNLITDELYHWKKCAQRLENLGTFQISDLTYNTLGGAVGGVIYYLGYSRKRKK